MQSVLRPQNSSAHSGSESLPSKRPATKRGRRRLAVHWGALAVCGLGLWLLGGVAWWQYQWWQPTQGETAETDMLPAHRIASEGQLELR